MSCTLKYVLQLILYGLYYPLLYGSIVSYWKAYRKSVIGLTLTASVRMTVSSVRALFAICGKQLQSPAAALHVNRFENFKFD